MADCYIGLMSGTSIDGVDGVLAEFEDRNGELSAQVLAHVHEPFSPELRDTLLALNTTGPEELHCAALAANGLARVYAKVVGPLRTDAAEGDRAVRAIGAHGQTVRHRPGLFDGTGYSLQINAPALLAELTGIDVVADFRSRDVAAGGQGAPLVPAFHRAVFGRTGVDRVVANVGGIANLSFLGRDGSVRGHDCGPGNVLMDAWCLRHTGKPYDDGGAWAASGQPVADLLSEALAHPYFARSLPKSTGRDEFHLAWLDGLLDASPQRWVAADVQATLCELTALTMAGDIRAGLPSAAEVIVCGGGAYNTELLRRLRAALPRTSVTISSAHGIDPMHVEAMAFAWLARAHVLRAGGNVPEVTGATGLRVLGALYPA